MATQLSRVRHMRFNQQGVVLIVGLIMVLLISIIALASIRGSGLQEAIAGNMRGRNIAFQATDSGIAYAEQVVGEPTIPIECVDGQNAAGIVCWNNLEYTGLVNSGGSVMYFNDTTFASNANAPSLGLPDIANQPLVIIEKLSPYKSYADGSEMGMDSRFNDLQPYRITSKGVGITADSSAIIQSTYNKTAN